jgi:hypothetical protein
MARKIAAAIAVALMLATGTILLSQHTIAVGDAAGWPVDPVESALSGARDARGVRSTTPQDPSPATGDGQIDRAQPAPLSTSERANGPYIIVSHARVIPSQTIQIGVFQHDFALNPYQLLWVESATGAFHVISATLTVDQEGNRPVIPYVVPAGNQGIYFVETRRDALITRSLPIEAVAPVFTYLPATLRGETAVFSCPTSSSNVYVGGAVTQEELDNPVRPAYDHADKNIALRSYTLNTDSGLKRELVDYGAGDPAPPPQFATLFSPTRVPDFSGFYQVHNWNWATSPAPGTRGDPIQSPPVTALGLKGSAGEMLRIPSSGYDIGGGFEAVVLFADEDTVTLAYTRFDTAARGYAVHIDNICTDPNLLALYNSLDDPQGPRYVYVDPGNRPYAYDLPTLAAGQPIGTVGAGDPVVAIADTGTLQDPRSCNEWWQVRPGYAGTCPPGP